jgi:hypothetical protein
MAKKKKEVCPYCGKTFAYLSRHKCKIKEKLEGTTDDKSEAERRIERFEETKKKINRNLKKEEKKILDIINREKEILFEELLERTNKNKKDLDEILEVLALQSTIKISRELFDSSWTKRISAFEDFEDIQVKEKKVDKKKKDFIWELFSYQPCFICPFADERCNETNPTRFNPHHCPWLSEWIEKSLEGKEYKVTFEDFEIEDESENE